MSCDNSFYHIAVDLDPCFSPAVELGDFPTARETDVEGDKSPKQGRLGAIADQSKSKGHRREVQSRIIPDSSQTDPEYIWGDEGPIND